MAQHGMGSTFPEVAAAGENLRVTGDELDPDCRGLFTREGTYNEAPYYVNYEADPPGYWKILKADSGPGQPNERWFICYEQSFVPPGSDTWAGPLFTNTPTGAGTYNPGGEVTGTATAAAA